MLKRTHPAAFVLAAAAAVMAGAWSTPAAANNFIGCSGSGQPCFANNSTHYMSYNLTTGWRTATEATRTGSYETTRLTTILSNHDSSDVYYEVETQSASYYGSYFCVTFGASGTCNHAHITYNGPNGAGLTATQLKSVACHETGHTVGLRHPWDVGGDDNDQATYRCTVVNGFPDTLGPHNAVHIDGRY